MDTENQLNQQVRILESKNAFLLVAVNAMQDMFIEVRSVLTGFTKQDPLWMWSNGLGNEQEAAQKLLDTLTR